MLEAQGISDRPEDLTIRRSMDRSEDPATLEEQLGTGLVDTFPASDPVAVVSPTISGQAPKLVGTDEILAQRRAARAALVARRRREQRADENAYTRDVLLGTGGIVLGLTLALGSALWLSRPRRE